MAAATMTSRLLGMVREMVYAAFMGNTWVASAFVLAFQVPNLFRRLLGEGALTAAFIPLFKKKESAEGEAAMWQSGNAVISGLIVAAGAVTVLAILVISGLLVARDFIPERRLMLELLRFMFPYMTLACLAAVLIGMANARGHFFIPALGAAMLNVVMIGSVLWLAPRMGTTLDKQIFGLALQQAILMDILTFLILQQILPEYGEILHLQIHGLRRKKMQIPHFLYSHH